MIKFYDTNAALDLQEEVFREDFLISNITLTELEEIKNSRTKDEDIKLKTRKLLRLLDENQNKYRVIFYKDTYDNKIKDFNLANNNDSKIIISAYMTYINSYTDMIFVTNDLACKMLAKSLNIPTESIQIKKNTYTGYKQIYLTDAELANFYNKTLENNENIYSLLINEYLLITGNSGEIIDKYKWTIEGYKKIPFYKFESKMFGKIIPKNGDPYQHIAMDTLTNNQISMLRGPAGSGKSFLAMGYLMEQLEKGKIDKILIFCNTVAVRGSAKLGYYPGSRDEKLLDSQIGNFLAAKFGSMTQVEEMLDEGTLVLLPVSDIRGVDTSGMRAGIYVTEAQNTSIDIMKLMLQRVGEDCICIIDGDDQAQVDMMEYNGNNNGMRRLSEVFKGNDFYGETTLNTIYRSKIAEIAELM